MPAREQYSKAPITEAVVQFVVESEERVPISQLLEEFKNRLGDQYPRHSDIVEANATFRVGAEPGADLDQAHTGYRFSDAEEKNLLLVQANQLNVVRLPPYTGWEEFRERIRIAWEVFSDVVQPSSVKRLSSRYINRIDNLPENLDDFSSYFTAQPAMPATPSRAMVTGFFLQVKVTQPDIDAVLVFQQALLPPAVPGTNSVLLDFDLHSENDSQGWPASGDALWQALEKLHDRHDVLFEVSITDQTRELIR